MIFDIENLLLNSNFGTSLNEAAKIAKASRNAYNQEGWIIQQDLSKNWVAKGVASEVNNFTNYYRSYFEFNTQTYVCILTNQVFYACLCPLYCTFIGNFCNQNERSPLPLQKKNAHPLGHRQNVNYRIGRCVSIRFPFCLYMSVLGSPKGPMSSNCAIHSTYIRNSAYPVQRI